MRKADTPLKKKKPLSRSWGVVGVGDPALQVLQALKGRINQEEEERVISKPGQVWGLGPGLRI